eukprot:3197509-Rhodomonas_salina.2
MKLQSGQPVVCRTLNTASSLRHHASASDLGLLTRSHGRCQSLLEVFDLAPCLAHPLLRALSLPRLLRPRSLRLPAPSSTSSLLTFLSSSTLVTPHALVLGIPHALVLLHMHQSPRSFLHV